MTSIGPLWEYSGSRHPIKTQKGTHDSDGRAEDKQQRKIIIPPLGKPHNALCLRECRHRILCVQWFVGRFPSNANSTQEILGGIGAWCVKTLSNISKALWTEKDETSIVGAINIILNHTD